MAKQCRDEGRKKLKKNVQVTPNVVAENHRTIRLTKAFNKYFFRNRVKLAFKY